jgi:hypothetical protein
MRTNFNIFLLLIFTCLFASCKKETSSETGIIGKWKLVEQYNGYANGGDFKWSPVPEDFQKTISFQNNGAYSEYNKGQYPDQCNGTYSLINSNEVLFNSACSSEPYTLRIDRLPNKLLVITYMVRQGEIKQKFIQIK